MLFKNLWVDPANVVAVFCDVDCKRARVLLKDPPTGEMICDAESAQELLKHLDATDETKHLKRTN